MKDLIKEQKLINYWAHMLDGCKLDEDTNKDIDEATSAELASQQAVDDEAQYANVTETRVGEHFTKFLKAVKENNITPYYTSDKNKKANSTEQAIGIALSLIVLGFYYRSEMVSGNQKEFYSKCFNQVVEYIREKNYSAAQTLIYIVDHLTEFDEEYYSARFGEFMTDPEVY